MKKILFIGAGFLQNFVIRRAKQMGYCVLAVDGNPEAVGFAACDDYAAIDIVDKQSCLAFAEQESIDGVLTVATDYGVVTASYIAQKLGLPGLSLDAAFLVKDKYRVRKRLHDRRVDDAGRAFEFNDETDERSIPECITYPVMVKPCDGSGSRGATRVDGPDGLVAACRNAVESSLTRRAEIEPFIDGDEYGVESFVLDGEINVLGVMKKWMTPHPYYAELGHAIPSGLDCALESKITLCAKRAIEALGIDYGSVNMDIIVSKSGGVHIVDVGARMGGNMIGPCIIPYGTGIDYLGNVVRASVGDSLNWDLREKHCVATRLLAFEGGRVVNLPNFRKLEADLGVEIYENIISGAEIPKYKTNLDGCGYVVSCSEDMGTAIEKAERAKHQIGNELFNV